MLWAIALCSLLSAPPVGGASEPAVTGAPPVRQPSAPLVLRVPGDDFAPLRDALEARLPTVRVLPHRTSTIEELAGREFVFAEVTATEGGEVRLVVILQDGRFYERSFAAGTIDRVHSIATTMANTLAAIQEERIEPTRNDVAIPEPQPDNDPRSVTRPTVVPAPTSPVHAADITTVPAAPLVPPVVRRFEIGVTPSGAALIGLGPGGVAGPAGGAGLDLDLRLPIGLLVSAGLRHATRGSNDVRLHRFAVHVGVGHSWRRREFELRTIVAFVVEPWLVSHAGRVRTIRNADGERPGPLVGAVLGVSPGWLWRRHERSNVAMRLGMRAQLQLANLASGGLGRIRVNRAGAIQEIARIGGVELVLGADATLWFTVARRSASP